MTRWRCAFAVLFLLGLLVPAQAHDPGLSTAQGVLWAENFELTTGFAVADARELLPSDERGSARWTEADFAVRKARLLALAPGLWEVRRGAEVLALRDVDVALLPDDNVSFVLNFAPFGPGDAITLRALRLAELPPGHCQWVSLNRESGATLARKLLSAADATLEFSLRALDSAAAPDTTAPRFWGFLKLGIAHIWTGYDHLLFLVGLLIVCRTFRSIVTIITCFTLAHSLTLALATLDLVNLAPRLVEPAIAASIVFVGVENLWRRGAEPRGRRAVTFAFGLIHGFGFATVLRDLGVGSDGRGLVLPLFSFNLGVEVGQIVVAGCVLPLVWQLRKTWWFECRGVLLLSGLVAAAGLYWMLERLVSA